MSVKLENKLQLTDTRMLLLIDKLKANQTIKFQQQFCDTIGMLKQNIRNIKKGTQHFTTEHIRKACKTYRVNANWIFGLEKEMWRK